MNDCISFGVVADQGQHCENATAIVPLQRRKKVFGCGSPRKVTWEWRRYSGHAPHVISGSPGHAYRFTHIRKYNRLTDYDNPFEMSASTQLSAAEHDGISCHFVLWFVKFMLYLCSLTRVGYRDCSGLYVA